MHTSTTITSTQLPSFAPVARERVHRDARKGVRVQGGWTPHSQALRDLVVSRRAQPGQLLPTDVRVWEYLFDRYNEFRNANNSRWMPSQKTIATDLSMSQATVCNSLERLELAGLLDRGTQAGSSGWTGAKLYLPDYTPRTKNQEPRTKNYQETLDTSGASVPAQLSFFGQERFRIEIASDSETESQISAYPFKTPNDPNQKESIPPTTPVVVVGQASENCKTNSDDATIGEPGSSAPRRSHFSGLELEAIRLMIEFGVSHNGTRKAACELRRRCLLNPGYVAALIAYVLDQKNIRETPQALFQSLAATGFNTIPGKYWRAAEPAEPLDAGPPIPANGPRSPYADVWQRVLDQLRADIDARSFSTWLEQTALVALDEQRALVGVPNIFARERLEAVYLEQIQAELVRVVGRDLDVGIVLGGFNERPDVSTQ